MRASVGLRGRACVLAACVAGLLALPLSARAAEAPGTGQSDRDPRLVAQLLALDPERIDGAAVAAVLARFPAPRIVLLQGSLAPVTMEPFAQFLVAMGYPADRISDAADRAGPAAGFGDSARLAGMLAWYYEADGVRPLVIGHSRGGMLAIRVLHELAGAFAAELPVWNPLTDAAEHRTAIVDPLSGRLQSVVGLKLPYVAALATGKLPRILLGQWTMLPLLRRIPDTVEEFTGFAIEWDVIAGQFPGAEPYAATGSAAVRNVTLPPTYSHLRLPRAAHLAANPATRAWIDAYAPGAALPDGAEVDTENLVHAADIWHSVKKHWCLEARRLVLARQGSR
jgi:hypothetical protein